ncbi:MAG: DSD1 family PLP-dependent enzyme [Pirellulaceae bacterium]|nr:DSD1 family PLP-dependent enzyme [Pirellulaceae bacterium]
MRRQEARPTAIGTPISPLTPHPMSAMPTSPTLGCSKADLDTPALCVDLDAMEHNIDAVAAACRGFNVSWRPHAKCHKSPLIGAKLTAAGAIGLTCAKLGEAEVMATGGIQDLLIANMLVGPRKVARLVELRKIADPIATVDHVEQARPIGDAMASAGLQVRMIVEVDIGLGRVGSAPGAATLELANFIHGHPGLELAGVMGYEGHLLTIEDLDEKKRCIKDALQLLVENASLLRQAGLPCPIVSCGGTGSFVYSVEAPGITELQAGGAIFMDEFYREKCQVTHLRHALSVVVTVVSTPAADRAIIDAGRKTMHGDFVPPRVVGRDDLKFDRLSAEHGALTVDANGPGVRIGDRLEVIPGYSDMTNVLHNHFYGFRQDSLEVVWSLDARGRLQ